MTAPTIEQPGTERLPDMDVITGEGARVTINKIPVTVKPVKTHAFKALMQVFYVGLGPALGQIRLNFAAGVQEVGAEVIGLMLMALPNAMDEAVQFLLTVLEADDGDAAQRELRAYLLDDPDPLELIDAAEAVAVQEAPHIVQIMGKAQAAWTRVAPLYQKLMPTPKPSGATESGGGDRSPRHST